MIVVEFVKWTYGGVENVAELSLGKTCKIKSVQLLETEAAVETIKPELPKPKPKKKKGCGNCAASNLKKLVRGGGGLSKVELGVDAANKNTIIKRRSLCESCGLYDFGICDESKGGCGCFCAAKVKLKTEKCPEGRW